MTAPRLHCLIIWINNRAISGQVWFSTNQLVRSAIDLVQSVFADWLGHLSIWVGVSPTALHLGQLSANRKFHIFIILTDAHIPDSNLLTQCLLERDTVFIAMLQAVQSTSINPLSLNCFLLLTQYSATASPSILYHKNVVKCVQICLPQISIVHKPLWVRKSK